MNDYIVKIIHPEWGEQFTTTEQANNAYEALEKAVGFGGRGSCGEIMTGYVKNVSTGFMVRIEYTFD